MNVDVILRPLIKDDWDWSLLEYLRSVRSHPFTLKRVAHHKKITRTEQEYWYENEYSSNKDCTIFIAQTPDRTRLGYIQVYIESIVHRRARFFWVCDPLHTGKADSLLVNAAINHILTHDELEYHRLECILLESDTPALSLLMDEFGFVPEGGWKDYCWKPETGWNNAYMLSKIIPVEG